MINKNIIVLLIIVKPQTKPSACLVLMSNVPTIEVEYYVVDVNVTTALAWEDPNACNVSPPSTLLFG